MFADADSITEFSHADSFRQARSDPLLNLIYYMAEWGHVNRFQISSRESIFACVSAGDVIPHNRRATARLESSAAGCLTIRFLKAWIVCSSMFGVSGARISSFPAPRQPEQCPQESDSGWPKWSDSRAAWHSPAAANSKTWSIRNISSCSRRFRRSQNVLDTLSMSSSGFGFRYPCTSPDTLSSIHPCSSK